MCAYSFKSKSFSLKSKQENNPIAVRIIFAIQ